MIRYIFGSPRCGKTTLAVRWLIKEQRKKHPRYQYFFANFSQSLCPNIGKDWLKLGCFALPFGSYVVLDESGVDVHCRKHKDFPFELLEHLKLHGHYGYDMDFISQGWDDVDKVIRTLAEEFWYVRKFGPFSMVRRIFKEIRVDKDSYQIIDGYRVASFFGGLLPWNWGKNWFLFLRFPYYRFFDTLERPNLLIRDYSDRQPPPPPSLFSHWRSRLSAVWSKIKPVAAVKSDPTVREAADNSPSDPDPDPLPSDPPEPVRWICSDLNGIYCQCSSCGWSLPVIVGRKLDRCPQCQKEIIFKKEVN